MCHVIEIKKPYMLTVLVFVGVYDCIFLKESWIHSYFCCKFANFIRSNKRLITSINARTVWNKKLDFLNFLKQNHKDYIEVVVSQELKVFLNPKNLISTKFMNMLRTWFSKQFYALLMKKSTSYLFCFHAHFTLPTRFYKMLSVYLFKAKKAAILSMKISTKSRLWPWLSRMML